MKNNIKTTAKFLLAFMLVAMLNGIVQAVK